MSTSAPLNLVPVNPSLRDLLELLKKDILLSLSCHHIGTIESFDAAKQTATASINYTKTFYQFQPATQQYVPVQLDYPALIDCPVIILGGADAGLTMPIAKGDECLILFNDRDIDNWFSGASNGPVATSRLHSFSDGLILVGLNSLANSFNNYDTARAVLRNGNALVGVGTSLVKIANNTTTLLNLMKGFIDAIDLYLATGLVASGSGAGGTLSFAAGQAAFDAYKTTFAELLE